MSLRRPVPAACAVGLSALALSACGELSEDSGLGAAEEATVCMVAEGEGFEDLSFHQSAHEGLEHAARDTGVSTRESVVGSDAESDPALRSMVQSGCDLTIANGQPLSQVALEVAAENPQAAFATVDDSAGEGLGNVKPLSFDSGTAAFLAGYLAAGTTETGTVAAFGGEDIPRVRLVLDGFAEGVEHWNEQKDDDVELLGWDRQEQEGTMLGSFKDVEGAREVTEGFLDNGADIVLPAAGGASEGTAQAVAATGEGSDQALFIWVDTDGYDVLPEAQRSHQLTSVLKDLTGPVESLVRDLEDGELDLDPYVGTLENGGVGIADHHDQQERVGPELAAEVAWLRQQIIDGELEIESQEDAG